MTKPTLLLAAACIISLFVYGQKTDTLIIFYAPGKFNLSPSDQKKLDNFLLKQWDRISINGHTDDTEDDEYNMELSKRRSESVYNYFATKKVNTNYLSLQFFGEATPVVSNSTDDSRALNRRTEIIAYHFPRPAVKVVEAPPTIPVTKAMDNGMIITYRPRNLPSWLANYFDSGNGSVFQMVSNTTQMRQYNLYNNTTNGEILSSVMIVCGPRVSPCKLDSPIIVKVPVPNEFVCPIEKVKFFNSTLERGKWIWKEQNKALYPEVIDGRKYIRLALDEVCGCINFDFKIDPECFDTDTARLLFTRSNVKNLSAELKGLNSVYIPRKINDSSYQVLHLKDKANKAAVSFVLYDGKTRIKTYRDRLITDFPYDRVKKEYSITTTPVKLYFQRLKVSGVVLHVNKDIYKTFPRKRQYSFVYLNQVKENISVDFYVTDSKGIMTHYKNQSLESLPFDAVKNRRVISKKFLQELELKARTEQTTAKRTD